jgi:hypothetical protein
MKPVIAVGWVLGLALVGACVSQGDGGGGGGGAFTREGTFKCGSGKCDSATEMCSYFLVEGGSPSIPDEIGCAPIPAQCLGMATCGCVLAHWDPPGFRCDDTNFPSGAGTCNDQRQGLEVCGKIP